MAKSFPTIAAIDFGTSKVACLLCEINPSGLEVIGFGESFSQGIRKGVVVNIESAVQSLEEAMQAAQQLSDREAHFVVAGVSGNHLQSISSQGMLAIRDHEIRQSDVHKLIEAASAISLPLDRELIQILVKDFVIDGQEGIREPVGMYGRRLEASVDLITGSITSLQNLRRALEKAGFVESRFLAAPLALGRAVLTDEEKEAGVCVVDIGAASTDLAVYEAGVLRWMRSLSIGGMHLTNDLAVGLKIPLNLAEQVKRLYGCPRSDADGEESFELGLSASGETRSVSRQMLNTILQPRIEEMMLLIRRELAKEGVDESLPTGIVLTGGSSQLKGLLPIAQQIFPLSIRFGRPIKLGGLSEMISNPSYAVLVGLVQLGFEESEDLNAVASYYKKRGLRKVHAQVAKWVREFF
ncbi:MAG: cell division protein FtsA [Bradymonadales bacterium]|nr:MAG: cell division protein FtsA [Bradymonadales bacterium]